MNLNFLQILASFCKISKIFPILEIVPQFFKEHFQLFFTLFLLLQQLTHISLQFFHLRIEVDLLVAVDELDVLAGHQRIAFFCYGLRTY